MMGIKNNLFKANNYKANNYDDYYTKEEVIAGGVFYGGLVGAIGGLIYGYNQARNEIKKKPVESVTLTYKLPTYETKEIGKIPQDQYIRRGWGYGSGSINLTPIEPVYEKVPVKDDSGKVVYKEVTETLSGYGKPIINYNTYEVKEPVFKGYTQDIILDKDCYYDYDDEYTECEVRGYWIRFYPRVDYKVIDTYQVPQVRFDHGVDVLGKTMKGLALGTAVGAIMGGILGAVAYHLDN
jgi:hypothetical protein